MSDISITKPDFSALGSVTFDAERGVPSSHLQIAIRNLGTLPVEGLFFVLYAEKTPGMGDYDTTDHPIVDERLGRFKITSVDSSGTPGQFAILGQTQPLGHLAVAQLPTLLAGDSVFADVWIEQGADSAFGGAVNVKFEVAAESPARGVPNGLTAVGRGILTGLNESRSFMLTGRAVTPTGSPDDKVHAAAGSWLLGGVEYTDASIENLTLNQNDSAPSALTAGQSYIALITQGSATIPTVTKGLKGTTPADPTAPSGEILLARVVVHYQASTSIISSGDITQNTLLYGRYLVVDHPTGLAVDVHAGEALVDGFETRHDQIDVVTLTPSTTNYVWLNSDGSITATTSNVQPAPGSIPLKTVVTGGSNISSSTDTRVFAGAAGVLAPHASTHASGGSDPVSPASIGAAPLASPALTGTPTAPTPSALDNSTKLATTAYVDSAVAAVDPGATSHRFDHIYYSDALSGQPPDLSPIPLTNTIPRWSRGGLEQADTVDGGADFTSSGTNREHNVFASPITAGEKIKCHWTAAS